MALLRPYLKASLTDVGSYGTGDNSTDEIPSLGSVKLDRSCAAEDSVVVARVEQLQRDALHCPCTGSRGGTLGGEGQRKLGTHSGSADNKGSGGSGLTHAGSRYSRRQQVPQVRRHGES